MFYQVFALVFRMCLTGCWMQDGRHSYHHWMLSLHQGLKTVDQLSHLTIAISWRRYGR